MSRPVTLAAFAAAFAIANAAHASLVLEYTFENGSGTVQDTSGSANNAPLPGSGAAYDSGTKKFGNYSMGLSGSDGYLVPQSSLSLGNQFTVFAAVYSGDSNVSLFSLDTPTTGFSFGLAGGRLTFQSAQNFGLQSDPQSFGWTPANNFKTVAVTIDKAAQELKFYYEGAQVPVTASYGGNGGAFWNFVTSGTAYVGAYWSGAGLGGFGSKYVDQFQIYDTVLSAGEIATLNATGTLAVVPEPTTLASVAIFGLVALRRRA